jgi:hypothetical protein
MSEVADHHALTRAEFDEQRETDYRRGFHQGVSAAVEALISGYQLTALKKWQERLREWRGKRHKGKPERPEWLHDIKFKPLFKSQVASMPPRECNPEADPVIVEAKVDCYHSPEVFIEDITDGIGICNFVRIAYRCKKCRCPMSEKQFEEWNRHGGYV